MYKTDLISDMENHTKPARNDHPKLLNLRNK